MLGRSGCRNKEIFVICLSFRLNAVHRALCVDVVIVATAVLSDSIACKIALHVRYASNGTH